MSALTVAMLWVNYNYVHTVGYCLYGTLPLAALGGRARCTPLPTGPNSFVFTYIFIEKCLHRGSTTSLMGPRPPTGNPGSATDYYYVRATACPVQIGAHHHIDLYTDINECLRYHFHLVDLHQVLSTSSALLFNKVCLWLHMCVSVSEDNCKHCWREKYRMQEF